MQGEDAWESQSNKNAPRSRQWYPRWLQSNAGVSTRQKRGTFATSAGHWKSMPRWKPETAPDCRIRSFAPPAPILAISPASERPFAGWCAMQGHGCFYIILWWRFVTCLPQNTCNFAWIKKEPHTLANKGMRFFFNCKKTMKLGKAIDIQKMDG